MRPRKENYHTCLSQHVLFVFLLRNLTSKIRCLKHFKPNGREMYQGHTANFLDNSGSSPLQIATAHKDQRSAIALLQVRADVGITIPLQATLRHVACHSNLGKTVSESLRALV